MTKLLLDKEGICNSKKDEQGWTPLHFAAQFGYIEILQMLLEKDKDAAYKADKEGKTALHVAAAVGKVEIMQELLSTCPGCYELVDNKGWNVLHFASTSQNIRAIRLILGKPSLRNLVNEKEHENGNTPLLQAASMGHMSRVLRRAQISTAVDKLVFNRDNHNAADIISADKSTLFTVLSLLFLERNKVSPGMRTKISKTDNGKSKSQEGEVQAMSSESDNGNDTRGAELVNKIKENNLLAAILIATVSFAAAVTIPGGFITGKGAHHDGKAILTGNIAFTLFVVFNTMSFFLSSFAVVFHLYERFLSLNTIKHVLGMVFGQCLTTVATFSMMGAFLSATWAVLQSPEICFAIVITVLVGAVIIILIVAWACYFYLQPSTCFRMMPPGMEKIILHVLNQDVLPIIEYANAKWRSVLAMDKVEQRPCKPCSK